MKRIKWNQPCQEPSCTLSTKIKGVFEKTLKTEKQKINELNKIKTLLSKVPTDNECKGTKTSLSKLFDQNKFSIPTSKYQQIHVLGKHR